MPSDQARTLTDEDGDEEDDAAVDALARAAEAICASPEPPDGADGTACTAVSALIWSVEKAAKSALLKPAMAVVDSAAICEVEKLV